MNQIGQIVTEGEVEKALDFLRDNAKDIGDAKAATIEAGHMVKHIMALEMKRHEGSAALQEREARSSDRYMEACITEAKAAGVYEYLKALREAAAMKLEIYRTQSSNFRAMKIS